MKSFRVSGIIPGLMAVFFNFFSGCASLQSNGDILSRERTVGEFSGITLDYVGDINIHFAETYRVVVTAASNIQDIVTTVVRKNMLTVGLKRNMSNSRIVVDVYLPRLEKINLKGVGSIEAESGNGFDLEIRHTGVGSINLENYRVENATIISDGVGTIKLWAADSLNGKCSGVITIQYRGSPRMNMEYSGVGGFDQIK
jgi:hypothetical protein